MPNRHFFQSIALFSKASESSIVECERLAKDHFYKKGEFLLRSTQEQNVFLYVIRGWVKVAKESGEGEEIIVDVLTQQDYYGEQQVFQTDNIGADLAALQALTDTYIFTLPIPSLKKLTYSDPALSLGFMQHNLAKQAQMAMEIEHLSIQNASQRIGCVILRLAEVKQSHPIALHLPYDKTILATRLGMRPETFSRALAKLCEHCDVEVSGDTIRIYDLNRLVDYVCSHCSKTFPCYK